MSRRSGWRSRRYGPSTCTAHSLHVVQLASIEAISSLTGPAVVIAARSSLCARARGQGRELVEPSEGSPGSDADRIELRPA